MAGQQHLQEGGLTWNPRSAILEAYNVPVRFASPWGQRGASNTEAPKSWGKRESQHLPALALYHLGDLSLPSPQQVKDIIHHVGCQVPIEGEWNERG